MAIIFDTNQNLTSGSILKVSCNVEPAAAAAKSLQSCPTLWGPTDGSPPGSPVPGILQARTLEWVAISFSNAWKWKNKVKLLSRVWLLAGIKVDAYARLTISAWYPLFVKGGNHSSWPLFVMIMERSFRKGVPL